MESLEAFRGIIVTLLHVDKTPISSMPDGSPDKRKVQVSPGEHFLVSLRMDKAVSSGGLGNLCVEISLGGDGEGGRQMQTWLVNGNVLDTGVARWSSFKLWNHPFNTETKQPFNMPKPDDEIQTGIAANHEQGTIKVTVSRVTTGYASEKFEPRPEVPPEHLQKPDLKVCENIYIIDPRTIKIKKHGNNRRVFIFRNTGSANGVDQEPTTGRSTKRHATVVPIPPRRAAAEASDQRRADQRMTLRNVGKILDSTEYHGTLSTRAFAGNGIPSKRSRITQEQDGDAEETTLHFTRPAGIQQQDALNEEIAHLFTTPEPLSANFLPASNGGTDAFERDAMPDGDLMKLRDTLISAMATSPEAVAEGDPAEGAAMTAVEDDPRRPGGSSVAPAAMAVEVEEYNLNSRKLAPEKMHRIEVLSLLIKKTEGTMRVLELEKAELGESVERNVQYWKLDVEKTGFELEKKELEFFL